MGYLTIMVLLATAGIARLWVMQRKERNQLGSIRDFRTSLQTISPERPIPARRPGARPVAAIRPVAMDTYRPLDPARRQAAKRRLEQRRRVLGAHRSFAEQRARAAQRRDARPVRPRPARGAF